MATDTDMAESIVVGSAQDEVCGILWDILQVAKKRALKEINADNPYFDKQLINDIMHLTSCAGFHYRDHAEHQVIE